MPIAQLTYAVTLVVCSLFGRADASPRPAEGPAVTRVPQAAPARSGHAHVASFPARLRHVHHVASLRTDLSRVGKQVSQFDDEVETPDAPEDEIPDDHGQALRPENRPSHLIACLTVSGDGLPVEAPTPSHFHELVSDRQGRQRLLSLCRLLC